MDKKVVFFDGVCNFCNSTVNYIWDNNSNRDISFSSLQSEFSKDFFRKKKIDITDLNTIYFFENNVLYKKSDAIIKIALNLDGNIKLFGKVLKIIPKFLRDFGYKVFSKNRYLLFGKSDSCRLPTQEERNYFL